MPRMGKNLERYLRTQSMPTLWCPGCGHGAISRAILNALDSLELDPEQVVVLGGIGCSGRTPFYVNTNAMHTTHGRALAFATGVKLGRPGLTTIVTMGDGDAVGIGGNHFIHACRRNIDLTAVIYNNGIYGMTGGQVAPTTPFDRKSTTTIYGSIDTPFDIAELALAAGASFVARGTTYDFEEIPALIAKAIEHKGFSVVEILTHCPTYYGRLNSLGGAIEMLDYERDTTFQASSPSREEVVGKKEVGILRDRADEDYGSRYRAMCEAVRG
jgi:2-oxoglutarate/2-oxoacid ferredoxin oxidoreductase subunit beta